MRGYSAIGLYNPKKEPNLGGVFRAAHCYGSSLVVISGKRPRLIRFTADTTKAWKHLPVVWTEDLLSCVPVGVDIVGVELKDGAKPLPEFNHPERGFYIFGPEDGSIPDELWQHCTRKVMIPTKYCMNLAATVNVVLYDRLAKNGGSI